MASLLLARETPPLGGDTLVSSATGGNAGFRVELRGVTPSMPTWVIFSPFELPVTFGQGTLIPSFTTWILNYRGLADAQGSKATEFALPGSLTGFTFYAQWASTDPSLLSSCTNKWFNLSDAVRVTID